jgi:hypothetical protein
MTTSILVHMYELEEGAGEDSTGTTGAWGVGTARLDAASSNFNVKLTNYLAADGKNFLERTDVDGAILVCDRLPLKVKDFSIFSPHDKLFCADCAPPDDGAVFAAEVVAVESATRMTVVRRARCSRAAACLTLAPKRWRSPMDKWGNTIVDLQFVPTIHRYYDSECKPVLLASEVRERAAAAAAAAKAAKADAKKKAAVAAAAAAIAADDSDEEEEVAASASLAPPPAATVAPPPAAAPAPVSGSDDETVAGAPSSAPAPAAAAPPSAPRKRKSSAELDAINKVLPQTEGGVAGGKPLRPGWVVERIHPGRQDKHYTFLQNGTVLSSLSKYLLFINQ